MTHKRIHITSSIAETVVGAALVGTVFTTEPRSTVAVAIETTSVRLVTSLLTLRDGTVGTFIAFVTVASTGILFTNSIVGAVV